MLWLKISAKKHSKPHPATQFINIIRTDKTETSHADMIAVMDDYTKSCQVLATKCYSKATLLLVHVYGCLEEKWRSTHTLP